VLAQLTQHSSASVGEPVRAVLGRPGFLHVGDQPAAFVVGDTVTGCRLDDRQILGVH